MRGRWHLGQRPDWSVYVEALRRAAQPDGELWWGGAVAFYEQGFDRITTTDLRRELNGARPREIVADIRRDADRFGARDDLDRLIYQDLRLRLPELLLMRVDKLTMANAVEARVPFLDHELVELAMAIPRDREDQRRRRQAPAQARGLRPPARRPRLAAQAGVRHTSA